jgi:hypothetical protein
MKETEKHALIVREVRQELWTLFWKAATVIGVVDLVALAGIYWTVLGTAGDTARGTVAKILESNELNKSINERLSGQDRRTTELGTKIDTFGGQVTRDLLKFQKTLDSTNEQIKPYINAVQKVSKGEPPERVAEIIAQVNDLSQPGRGLLDRLGKVESTLTLRPNGLSERKKGILERLDDVEDLKAGFALSPSTEDWYRRSAPNEFVEVCHVSIETHAHPVWVGLVASGGDSFVTIKGNQAIYTFFRFVRDKDHEVAKYRLQPPAVNTTLELPPSSFHAIDRDVPRGRHRYSLWVKNANAGDTGNELAIFRASLAVFEIPAAVQDVPN